MIAECNYQYLMRENGNRKGNHGTIAPADGIGQRAVVVKYPVGLCATYGTDGKDGHHHQIGARQPPQKPHNSPRPRSVALSAKLDGNIYRVLARTTTPLSGARVAALAGKASYPAS